MHPQEYRIEIDEAWDLMDLYKFPHTYSQVYSVIYVLQEQLPDSQQDRKIQIFSKYPWRGGYYSAVNWFNGLYYTIPAKDRPKVVSIQYSSPGWIDLGLCVSTALTISHMLIKFSEVARHLNETYNQIQEGIQKNKLSKIKVKREKLKLKREQLKFLKESCETMANLMGFEHLKQIHALTGNPLITLKMLCSIYRRLRILSEFEDKGKTKITKIINEEGK